MLLSEMLAEETSVGWMDGTSTYNTNQNQNKFQVTWVYSLSFPFRRPLIWFNGYPILMN